MKAVRAQSGGSISFCFLEESHTRWPGLSSACVWLNRDFPATEPTISLPNRPTAGGGIRAAPASDVFRGGRQQAAEGWRGLEKLSFKNHSRSANRNKIKGSSVWGHHRSPGCKEPPSFGSGLVMLLAVSHPASRNPALPQPVPTTTGSRKSAPGTTSLCYSWTKLHSDQPCGHKCQTPRSSTRAELAADILARVRAVG